MEFDKNGILNRAKAAQQTAVVMDEGLRAYMLKVYNYMASGVLLTGIISLLVFKFSGGMNITLGPAGFTGLTDPFGELLFNSGFKWLVMLAPLGIVMYLSFLGQFLTIEKFLKKLIYKAWNLTNKHLQLALQFPKLLLTKV